MSKDNMAAPIHVHKVEQGEGSTGCDPQGVQISFKESTNFDDRRNEKYLLQFFRSKNLEATQGTCAADAPFKYLCVRKTGSLCLFP